MRGDNGNDEALSQTSNIGSDKRHGGDGRDGGDGGDGGDSGVAMMAVAAEDSGGR